MHSSGLFPECMKPVGFTICVYGVAVSGLLTNTYPACTYVRLRMVALLALSAGTPLGGSLYGSVAFHTPIKWYSQHLKYRHNLGFWSFVLVDRSCIGSEPGLCALSSVFCQSQIFAIFDALECLLGGLRPPIER